MDFTLSDAPAPKGFTITRSLEGHPTILYRTTGMWDEGCFFYFALSFCTALCVLFTVGVSSSPDAPKWGFLFLIPFWCAEFAIIGYILWRFFSPTSFILGRDILIIEKSLFWYKRRKEFPRESIVRVCQTRDNSGDDGFEICGFGIARDFFGLAIVGDSRVQILSRQPIEKSNWLGPILAKWAGVEYVTYEEQMWTWSSLWSWLSTWFTKKG